MKLVLALFLGLLLYAVPAKADEFVDAGISTIFGNASSAELVNANVHFDRDTQTIGSVQAVSSGTLGTFAFNSFSNFPAGLATQYNFVWDDSGGDTFTMMVADEFDVPHVAVGGRFDGPNVAGWSFLSGPFVFGSYAHGDPPSPTPEPSSLILLGLGLVSAVFMSRKLITS